MQFQPVMPPAKAPRKKVKRSKAQGLCLSTDVKRKALGDGRIQRTYAMRISVPADFLRLSGLEPGAKVAFDIDPASRRCRIRRDDAGRWRVSPNADSSKGYVRIVIRDGMQLPTVAATESCSGVRIRSGALEFTVPDNASFTSNLRAEKDQQPALTI